MAVFCPGAVIVPLQEMQDDLCPIAYPNCTLIDFIDMERSYRRPGDNLAQAVFSTVRSSLEKEIPVNTGLVVP